MATWQCLLNNLRLIPFNALISLLGLQNRHTLGKYATIKVIIRERYLMADTYYKIYDVMLTAGTYYKIYYVNSFDPCVFFRTQILYNVCKKMFQS